MNIFEREKKYRNVNRQSVPTSSQRSLKAHPRMLLPFIWLWGVRVCRSWTALIPYTSVEVPLFSEGLERIDSYFQFVIFFNECSDKKTTVKIDKHDVDVFSCLSGGWSRRDIIVTFFIHLSYVTSVSPLFSSFSACCVSTRVRVLCQDSRAAPQAHPSQHSRNTLSIR